MPGVIMRAESSLIVAIKAKTNKALPNVNKPCLMEWIVMGKLGWVIKQIANFAKKHDFDIETLVFLAPAR